MESISQISVKMLRGGAFLLGEFCVFLLVPIDLKSSR